MKDLNSQPTDLNISGWKFSNLSQNVIETTEDKLTLILMDFKEALSKKRDWLTPLSVVISLLTTFLTAEFKSFLGIPSSTIHAIFWMLFILSIVWLLIGLRSAFIYRKVGITTVLDKIKGVDE